MSSDPVSTTSELSVPQHQLWINSVNTMLVNPGLSAFAEDLYSLYSEKNAEGRLQTEQHIH